MIGLRGMFCLWILVLPKACAIFGPSVKNLFVLPKTPVISDEAGDILQSLIGPYNEGDTLKLICETEGGDPLPSLTWWREAMLLDDSFTHSPQGVTRNQLAIPSLKRTDLMAVLSCRANNNFNGSEENFLYAPPSAAYVVSTVTIDLNFKPVDVLIDRESSQFLSAQKTSELTCKSTGSRPPATISWWRGVVKLKTLRENVASDGNSTISILHIVATSDDHGEKLTCRAENLLMADSQVEDHIFMNVHYIPKVSLKLGNKIRHTHIQENYDVYLECSVKANPWVGHHISWLFEGRELLTNRSAGIILSNQTLVLQKVQRQQRGRYVCKAENSEGTGISHALLLRVQYAPICKSDQRFRYGAAHRETVTVSCEVEADHSQVTFHWLFNHTAHSSEAVPFQSDGLKSTATFHVAGEDHYGTLLCWATNAVGPQTTPCTFLIFQEGPPNPVTNCSATNQTENSFQVECTRTGSGSPATHYQVEVYDNQFKRLRLNATFPMASFGVRDLPAGTTYVVIVTSLNAKGKSEAFVFQTTTLAAPESLVKPSTSWPGPFSPILIVLVSVIVALVFVALTFLLVIKLRERSRQQKDDEDINKKEKATCSMDVLLKKECEEPSSKGSANCGLGERCPDILSDFRERDGYVANSRANSSALLTANLAHPLGEASYQEILETLQV